LSQIESALYIVATPIGNLADMTQRAIEVLSQVDVIAAEDTRHSAPLLQHFTVNTPMVSLHQHNEQQRTRQLIERIQNGESVALISDAGTPLISDPGYRLVSQIKEQNIKVIPIPGSCALITALSASGLPSERFSFEGFLPTKASARRQTLDALKNDPRTLIFYESPRRIEATINEMMSVFGAERQACLARELTKLHETIAKKPLKDLLEWVQQDTNQQRGECVLLVEGQTEQITAQDAEIEKTLQILLTELPVKKAAKVAASLLDISKNDAYDYALKLKQN
jgi:16S rRNA (cytidine1402-2'-O)-methyltransferase